MVNMHRKPQVLVIALEYYPIQNANTTIIGKLVSQLCDRFDFVIATQNIYNGPEKEIVLGIPVIRTPFHAYSKRDKTNNNTVPDLAKMVYFKLLSKYKGDDIKRKNVYYFVHNIGRQLNMEEVDLIVSFSNPFDSHYCASILAEKHCIPWIAYYLDPFFSNATYDKRDILKRKNTETKRLEYASKVLLTYPINEDYLRLGIDFRDKVLMAEMPGITDNETIENRRNHITPVKTGSKCKCYFVGNLYKDIRTPDAAIKAFSILKDEADLFFVGETYRFLQDKIKGSLNNVHFLGKKSKEEIVQFYREADILVNIGNAIDNQMPSKIFEYISTGKPIINFYKVPNCPTLKYLKKYPLALNIFEQDLLNDTVSNSKMIINFSIQNRGKTVPISWIKDKFKGNTDEAVANFLGEQMKSALKENE
jgi:glycosyltransferase involved in cell wall biosynthesis